MCLTGNILANGLQEFFITLMLSTEMKIMNIDFFSLFWQGKLANLTFLRYH